MGLKLKSKATAFATGGVAVTGIGVVANFAQIADFFANLNAETVATATQAILTSPTVPVHGLVASALVSAVIGYVVARKRGRAREAKLEVMSHRSEHFLRTDTAHFSHRLEQYSMSPNSLCRNLAHVLRGVCGDAESYFSYKEGRRCICTVHLLCEDGTLHAVEYRSRDGMEQRKNLSRKQIAPGTNMKRIQNLNPADPPLVRTEKIAATEADWRDPGAEDHSGLYDASITAGIQCKPDAAFDCGHFTPDLSSQRILAGFLTIDCEGSAFRSPGVEDAAFRFADRLFSVIREYSKAHYELTGESASPISWVYRDVAGVQFPDVAAE